MTTEIAVSNRLGIALAADSAVTITAGGQVKVFNTADKLFELSPQHPVGVMINGNMDCLGVPWEILVKDFRQTEGNKERPTVKDWATDFFKYIESHILIRDRSIYNYVANVANNEIKSILDVVAFLFRSYLFDLAQTSRRRKTFEPSKELAYVLEERKKYLEDVPIADSLAALNPDEVLASYSDQLEAIINEKFQGLGISDSTIRSIKELIVQALLRVEPSDYTAGVVIAGYGCEETFPSLQAAEVDGRVMGLLKLSWKDSKSIAESEDFGQVIYFAQTEVIQRLLGGADPQFVEKTSEFINRAVVKVAEAMEKALMPKRRRKTKPAKRTHLVQEVADTVTNEYRETTAESLRKEFSREFDRMIAMMPKQELIELAEALVSITAVEHKATTDEGTVGGPIDVAFITKHEGFVWIKRKHYFERELNPRYFWRKYGVPPERGVKC